MSHHKTMIEVFISIGSNIDREKNIPSSLDALQHHFGILTRSSLYESDAVGFDGSPFYNMVVAFETDRFAAAVIQQLKLIETEHGRLKGGPKFAARTLDLDLILYGEQVLTVGTQTVPRDEIIHCAFVLEPLAEIAPNLRHPVTGDRYADLWAQFDKSGLNQQRVSAAWSL